VAWDAQPDGIVGALEANQGAFKGKFGYRRFESERDTSIAIVESLEESMEDDGHGKLEGIPVIVLTFGIRHWVVVYGFQTRDSLVRRKNPTANRKFEDFEIEQIYIHDPLPTLRRMRDLPPPHEEHDLCDRYFDPRDP